MNVSDNQEFDEAKRVLEGRLYRGDANDFPLIIFLRGRGEEFSYHPLRGSNYLYRICCETKNKKVIYRSRHFYHFLFASDLAIKIGSFLYDKGVSFDIDDEPQGVLDDGLSFAEWEYLNEVDDINFLFDEAALDRYLCCL